jgi:hypothetical protein
MKDKPETISAKLRNWLNIQAQLRAPGPSKVWARFNEFMATNYDELTTNRGFSANDAANLPVDELLSEMKAWVGKNPLS